MRVNHLLRGNKVTSLPSRFITFDCETEPMIAPDRTKQHRLKVGVARSWSKNGERLTRDEIVFREVKEFWDWVEYRSNKNQSTTYLFSHNSHFDSLVVDMFNEMPKRGWEMTDFIIDSNIFIVNWYNEERGINITALDTLNFFKSSIAEIGNTLGLPKLEIDFDNCTMEELTIYCKRDVEITETIILEWFKFIRDNDLGNFQSTQAGQAFTSFRHRFMEHEIFIHNDEKAILLERESYRGGRNECFFIGSIRKNIHVYDFNSLYPSVMKGNLYPVNLVKYRHYNSLETLIEDMKEHLVIAELTIKVDKPLMAVRKERLLFPIGKFNGVFTTPEIKILLERNCIISVGRVACYQGAEIFNSYVDFFYNMRLEAKKNGNDVSALLYKYMLNSLYGKFGQRLKLNECIGKGEGFGVMRHIDEDTQTSYLEKTFGGKKYKCTSTLQESYNSFPAIASFCTSYARMKLLNAIEKAGWNNVYYVDTDSLFVNDEGKELLSSIIDQKKLGYLKHEYSGWGMEIRGCKDYIFYKSDGNISVMEEKIKGVSKRAEMIGDNEYKMMRFDKFMTSLKNKRLSYVTERDIVKHLTREYVKGTIGKNGWVIPYKLKEKDVGENE